ncbi:MAG: hydroxyacid dehydrogenase, partial [Candidatus Marsarchaeota archaeon]
MKVLVAEADEDVRKALQGLSEELNAEVHFVEDIVNKSNAARLLAGVEALSVFIYSKLDSAVFDSAPGLKFVCTRSTGYDHIDLAAAAERGITVSN